MRDRLWTIGQGITLGALASRLLAESWPHAWRLVLLLPLVCVALGLGLAAAYGLRRVCKHTWPVWLALVYVPWPLPSLTVAGMVLAAVAFLLLMNNLRSGVREGPLTLSVFLAALALDLWTLAPTVLPADSGEFQLVTNILGIAHPPGYPLYTLLGKLFTLLPVGDGAYRANLFGAVCGAATLAVLAATVRRSTGSTAAAWVVSAMLGLSTTFWAQSTTANIRSLTALLVALSIYWLLRWEAERSTRTLCWSALAFGLGAGHHTSVALMGIPLLGYVLLCEPRLVGQPRRWLPALGVLLASFVVLLYLPIRSLFGGLFDTQPIRSLAELYTYVTAQGFSGDLFYARTWPELLARIRVCANIYGLQFGALLSLGGLASLGLIAARRWHVAVLLGGVWLLGTAAAVAYRAPQTVEYLIPAYVALALALGYALGLVLHSQPHRCGTLLACALLLAACWNGLRNYPSFRELHQDRSARTYAETLLREAPANALILANWHYATPLWYLQQVEGLRPDVQVTYVYPEGDTPNEKVWLRRIDTGLQTGPVIVTNRFYAYDASGYTFEPLGAAWLVRTTAESSLPTTATALTARFEDGIEVLGYSLRQTTLAPGEALEVLVYWRSTQSLQRDYTSFVQLLGPQGVVGQADQSHPSHEYQPGEIHVDRYRFPLLLHTPPGQYQLVTGFYWSTDSGWQRLNTSEGDTLGLATVDVHAARESAPSLHSLGWSYEGGLQLAGVDYDRSVSGQTRIYLHWSHSTAIWPWADVSTPAGLVELWADGGLIAQADLPALSSGEAATVALDVPDSLRAVTLRLSTAQGGEWRRLGPWHRALARSGTLTLPTQNVRYIPLGGEMALVGFNVRTESGSPAGLWLQPRFLALHALTQDYSVSVGLERSDLGWLAKTDGTPASGAIPTLKWVRGWIVEDAHLLDLPENTPVGTARATLEVYQAFTLEPLLVLDERLVRAGQGTRLELDEVELPE